MKKIIMIMVMILTVGIVIQAQNQPVDSVTTVVNETKTAEQHLESIDAAVQAMSESISSLNRSISNSGMSSSSNWDFMNIGEEVLVPIVAITFIFGMPVFIVLIVFIFKFKERKAKYVLAEAALKAGKDVPPGLFNNNHEPSNTMAKGITNTFLGLGLGIFLWALTGEFGLGCIGFMITLIGIGQIIIHKTSRSSRYSQSFHTEDNEKNVWEDSPERKVTDIEAVSHDYTDNNLDR